MKQAVNFLYISHDPISVWFRDKCPSCGLFRHDPDAVHGKHCGATLRIETGGAA